MSDDVKTHPIATFDQLMQVLDAIEDESVSVESGVEDSMFSAAGVTATGILRRRHGAPYDDAPETPRSPSYDLCHAGWSIGHLAVDELQFVAAELVVFDTGQDCPRLFITQDVWRANEEYDELPAHRLQLVVWLEARLTFDPPGAGEATEASS